MTRGIQECDVAVVDMHSVRADVLCDTASLGGGNACVSDIVEQRGLAVVNVTHYNNDRITRLKALGIVGSILEQTLLDGNDNFLLDLCAEFLGNEGSGIEVDCLVEVSHNAEVEQLLDDLGSCHLQAGSQLGNNDLVRDLHLELLLSCTLKLQTLELLSLGLALAVVGLALLLGLLLYLLLALEALVAHAGSGSDCLVALVVLVKLNIAAAGVDHLCDLLAALNSLALLLLHGRSVHLDLGGVDSGLLDVLLCRISQRVNCFLADLAAVEAAVSVIVERGAVAAAVVIERRTVAVSIAVECRAVAVSVIVECGTVAVVIVAVKSGTVAAVVVELRSVAVISVAVKSGAVAAAVIVERSVAAVVVIELLTVAVGSGSGSVLTLLLSRLLLGLGLRLCFRLRLVLFFRLGFGLCFCLDLRICLGLGLCLDFRLRLRLRFGLCFRLGSGLCFRLGLGLYFGLCLCLCFSLRLLCGSFFLLCGRLLSCGRLLLLCLGLLGFLVSGSLEIFVKVLDFALLREHLENVANLLIRKGGLRLLSSLERTLEQLNDCAAVCADISRYILYTILFVIWQCNFPPYYSLICLVIEP